MNNKKRLIELYRDCGFSIIPIAEDTKKPLEDWAEFQKIQTPLDVLNRWAHHKFVCDGKRWEYQGEINWGFLTGAKPWSNIPGVVIMDADDSESIKLIETKCPHTPVIVRTPKGGRHYLYRWCGEVRNRQKTRYERRTYNLDIRGDGGFAMCVGTITHRGEYTCDLQITPDLIRSLPFYNPSWIIPDKVVSVSTSSKPIQIKEKLNKVPAAYRNRLAGTWLEKIPGAVQGEGADNYVFGVTMQIVWGFGLDTDDAVELLTDWGQRQDQKDIHGSWYPWSEKEMCHKVDGVLKRRPINAGRMFLKAMQDDNIKKLEEIWEQKETNECNR